MPAAPKDRKTTAYAAIAEAILTLRLAPGADLDEAQLCAEHGLSRTPMREVLRRLAGNGYVDLRENRGARVSEMSHTSLRDFFVAAPMIYGAILRLAAENRSAAQITELRIAQKDFRATLKTGTAAERSLANNRFHAITGDMAGNIYLRPSFDRLLLDHARISMTFYQPRDDAMARNVDEASAQHDAIIEAIADRDAARAGQLATEHWLLSRNQIELFVMPGGLDLPLGDAPNREDA